MRLTANGLVIRERAVGEHDRLVVVLTAERGKITAFANGARRIKHKNASSTGLLCYSTMTFFQNKGTYQLDESALIELFFKLRADIERLALAQYFCDLMLELAPEEEEAGEYLRLILNALHFLVEESRPPALIKAVVELRALSLAGYQPDLVGCAGCGRTDEQMSLHLREGTLLCPACQADIGGPVYLLGGGVLAAMHHIVYSEFDRIFHFSLPESAGRELARAAELYTLTQIDHSFKTLDFYHACQIEPQ